MGSSGSGGVGWRVGDRLGWSGGGFEGDLVAECFELVDVGSVLAFRADAVVVEVRAEVVVAGLGVRQQVPDDEGPRLVLGDYVGAEALAS